MKRRSNVLPIRPCDLFQITTVEKEKPVVPKHLDFSKNPTRRSFFGKPQSGRASTGVPGVPQRNPQSGVASTVVPGVPQRPRISLSGRTRNDVSVMDGVSFLCQTIDESPDDTDVTVQIPKQHLTSKPSVPDKLNGSSQVTRKPCDSKPTTSSVSTVNSVCNKTSNSSFSSVSTVNSVSSFSSIETKIPKPKIHTNVSISGPAELNSTAAFEGEEIAALTSTPHPDRKSGSVPRALSCAIENSHLEEQMKLFILDQRNLMQAVKLSFHKMNTVMDNMNGLLEKLSLQVDSQAELKLVKKSGSINSCGTVELTSLGLSDDKENVQVLAEKTSKPLTMFSDMKSQLKCLKTPTVLKIKPRTAETPNTALSNTVHNQLENLYETSETDD